MDDPTTSGVTEGFGLTCTRQGVFYNARYYDPALGRFVSADSLIPGGAQGLDRYAYVNNSPVNFSDPSGHKVKEDDPPPTETPPQFPTPCALLDTTCAPHLPQTIKPADKHPWGTHTEYITDIELGNVDWFHLITNGAGVTADVASALAALGFVPAIDVAIAGSVIDAVGIGADVIDAITNDNVSGVTWDTILYLAEETRLAKIVPFVGFTLNVAGTIDVWNAGKVTMPVQVPNEPPTITTP